MLKRIQQQGHSVALEAVVGVEKHQVFADSRRRPIVPRLRQPLIRLANDAYAGAGLIEDLDRFGIRRPIAQIRMTTST